MYTLTQTVAWAQTFIEYAPLTAGLNNEPAVSIATMVRNTILNAPFTWAWNRASNSSLTISQGTQDYTVPLTDFGFLEKVSLTDASSNVYEVKDVYNTLALGVSSVTTGQGQRPVAVSVLAVNYGTNVTLRFLGAPNATYTVTLIYQKLAIPFGSYGVTSVANAVAGDSTYTGIFTASTFPAGAIATITGFANPANNGSFSVVSCTATSLIVANPSGVSQSATASAFNGNWAPIPDSYMDIFNNLFIAEAFQAVDDWQISGQYRQRGVAALLSKAEGLSEVQKSDFLAQYLSRNAQELISHLRSQQGQQARGV